MRTRSLSIILTVGAALFSGFLLTSLAYGGEHGHVPERKIVTFVDGTSDTLKSDLLGKAGAQVEKHLHNRRDSVAVLDDVGTARLMKDGHVLRVEDDAIATTLDVRDVRAERISGAGRPAPTPPPQVLPWGVDKVDAERVWSTTTGSGVTVAVVDTGIDLAHPDLAAHVTGTYNAISSFKSATDDNGHGTHVAGTIGALNNTRGVVGVAPGVNLYAVKVLDRNGSGYYSDIIEGIDWAVAHGANVINMSLGGSSDVQALHDAVSRARDAGVVVVAAAGNSATAPVIYPAAYPEVIAVTATDTNDAIAYFSSFGPEVDLAAPGVNVYSTYKGQTYATLSGTSMASPHVAGAAALLLSHPVSCDTDSSGSCSPAEVEARLESTATDLGTLGRDDHFGYGLVNIWSALE